ncbi:hypothetical protein C4M80_02650, partial [Mycoplasmopsis pullorum]
MNKKKILNSTAAIAGIAAAGLTGVLLALHEYVTDSGVIIKEKSFGQISNAEKMLSDYLLSHMNSETQTSTLSKETEETVLTLMQELSEMKKNPNMDSAQAQKILDRIQHELAYAKLNEAIRNGSNEDVSSSLNDIVNEIKDPELKTQFLEKAGDLINTIKDQNLTPADKLDLSNQLKESTQSLYNRQSDILTPSQQTLWKLKDELRNNGGYFKPEEKAKAEAIIKTLDAAFNNNILSAENVSELTNSLNKAYNDLINAKKATENEYKKYLERSAQAKNSVLASNLPQAEKEKLLAQLDTYNAQAASPNTSFANNKLDEILHLEQAVEAIVNNLDDLNKAHDEIKNEVQNILDAVPTFAHTNLNDTLHSQLEQIQAKLNDPKLKHDDLVNLKQEAKALIDKAQSNQNSVNKTRQMIQDALSQGIILAPQAQELNAILDSINGENLDELSGDENGKIDEVVEKLVRAQKVNDDLSNLQAKVNVRKNDPDADADKITALHGKIDALKAQNLDQWDELDSENDLTWAAEDEVAKLYDLLRDANKAELKNLIAKGKDVINDPSISDAIKAQIQNLQMHAEPLTNDLSSSTNAQIEPRIDQYKKLLDDAALNKKVNDINAYTSDIKNRIAQMPLQNQQDLQAKILRDRANELLNKINSIYSDPYKTNAQKEAEIDALKAKIDELDSQLPDLQRLMDRQKRLKDAIKSLDANPYIKEQLLGEIEDANSLMEEQNGVFEEPKYYDIEAEIQKLKDLEDIIRDKQNALNSDQYYKKALAALNNAFSPYRNGVVPSELEAKLRAELEKQKAILDNPETSPSEYYDAIEKIKELQNNIAPAADLEKKRRELANEIQRTADTNAKLDTETPKASTASAESKLAEISNFIKGLENPLVGPSVYDSLKNDANAEIENLKVEQERAKLRDSIADLAEYITPAEETDTPEYKELANLVTNNLTTQKNLADAVANSSTSPQALAQMKTQVENSLPLAEKIKEAQLAHKNLTDPEDALVAQQLKDVIAANTLSLSDSPEQVNAKIQAISEELDKIETKQAIVDAIANLEQVYSEADKEKAIFATSEPALADEIAQFKEALANPSLSAAQLSKLKNDILRKNDLAKLEKKRLEKELSDSFKDAKALYEQLKQEALSKRGMSEADIAGLNAAWAEIEKLKDDDGNFSNPATPSLINELKAKMNLDYLKDVFDYKKGQVEKELDTFAETTAPENETESPTDKLKNTINDALQNWNDAVHPSDPANELSSNELKEYIAKLDALNTYADDAKDLLDAYTDSKNPEIILNAINNNLIDPATDKVATINQKADNLAQAKADSLSEEIYRENVKSKIDKLQNKLDDSTDPAIQKQLKDGDSSLAQKLADLETKLAEVKGKDEIKKIEDEIKKIQQNFAEISVLAGKVQNIADKVEEALGTANPADPIIEAFKKRFEEDLQVKAKEEYLNPNVNEINELENDADNYIDTLNAIKQFNDEYEVAVKKLEALTYSDGFGNIDSQEFKLNDADTPESFSTLTKENVKQGMQNALTVYKYFGIKINYPKQIMLNIKKEINILKDSLLRFENLIANQENTITSKYNAVKADNTAKASTFSNLNPTNAVNQDYGYEFDAKHIGEAILNSAIKNNQPAEIANRETIFNNSLSNYFSNLSVSEIEAKYTELSNQITQIKQNKLSNLKNEFNKTVNALDDLFNELSRLKNRESVLVLELETLKERKREIEAQQHYGKVYDEATIQVLDSKISETKASISQVVAQIKDKSTKLTEKQNENHVIFYNIKFAEFKIKELEDQISNLSDALYDKSFDDANSAQQMSLKNKALQWKNDIIDNKSNSLTANIDDRYNLYTTRQLKINGANSLKEAINDKLSTILPREATENESGVDETRSKARYQLFNNQVSDVLVQMLEYVKNSVANEDLDNYMVLVNNFFSKFETYKEIADRVFKLELEIEKVKADGDMSANKHMSSLITQLEQEIKFIKATFNFNGENLASLVALTDDQSSLNKWKKSLDFQWDKLSFYEEYVKQQKALDSYKQAADGTTNPANNDNIWFTQEEFTPLQTIINNAFTELYNSDYLTSENMQELKTRYLNGDNDTSVSTALRNSINLKKSLSEAQKIYDARKVDNGVNADTPLMNALYDRLGEKIAEGNSQLKNPIHDEINKVLQEDIINNPSIGLIAKLRDQKLKELKTQKNLAKDIKQYTDANYSNQSSVLVNEFEQKAITDLETVEAKANDENKAEFISEAINAIAESQKLVKQQLTNIFNFENNSLKSLVAKSKQYVQVFNGSDSQINAKGINADELKKLFKISQSDIDELITLIHNIPGQESYSKENANTWNIDDEYTNNNQIQYSDDEYNLYTETVENIKNKKNKLNSKYTALKEKTKLKLKSFKSEFDEAKDELETAKNDNDNP